MESLKTLGTILSVVLSVIALMNWLQTKRLTQGLASFTRIIQHGPDLEALILMLPALQKLNLLSETLSNEFTLNDVGQPNKDSFKDKINKLEKATLAQDQILEMLKKSMDKIVSSHFPVIDRGELLLVEDDSSGRKTMRFLLAKEGWTVASVSDMTSALRKLAFVIPDVVILDLNLPDGNGVEVLKFIKISSDNCRVLILTGETNSELLEEVEALGAEKIFSKPVDIKSFLSHVNGIK